MTATKKELVLKALCAQMTADLNALVQAALTAKEAATSEESKAENKYDTRGLEASYLAGAQALRSADLKKTLDQLQLLKMRDYSNGTPIHMTALVYTLVRETVSDTTTEKIFFLLPYSGGTKIAVEGVEYFSITAESNVGRALIGKVAGDSFEIKMNNKTYEYEVTQVL